MPATSEGVRHFRWDDMPLETLSDVLSRRFVTGEREMLAQIFLKRGCVVPKHSHESEQITYVLKGGLKFGLGDRVVIVRAGEVLCIPSWVEHSAEALEDTIEFDVFSPIRQDWLDKTDSYLRK